MEYDNYKRYPVMGTTVTDLCKIVRDCIRKEHILMSKCIYLGITF